MITFAALIFLLSMSLDTGGFYIPLKQGQTQLRHEVTVTLKLIQVYVADKKGNPVLGLTKDDFLVFDEGKKQALTEFERHVLMLPTEKEEVLPKVAEAPAPPARYLMPRKFFLFFDFAYNNGIGIEKARKAALHFIDTQLRPQDEVGIISYSAMKSLKLHEYLTTDHQKVREVARKFRMEQVAGRAEDFEVEYWQAVADQNPTDASRSGGVDDKANAEALRRDREESGNQTLHFAQKMIDLSKALRYIPGHKHIVFFSSGVPYSIIYGAQVAYGHKDLSDMGNPGLRFKYEDMLKELSAANCSVFTLDTQELRGTIDRDTSMRGSYTLQKMASATGGRYFGNINFYEKHVEKIQNLTGCYYVLGYYADDKWDGAYHNIKVEVTEPGYTVHAQKGYFNPKPFRDYSALEKMLHLVDLALSEEPLFQTPVRLPSDVFSYSSEGEADLCFISKMEAEKLREVAEGKLEVISVVFDKEGNIVKMHREEKTLKDLSEEDSYYYSFFSLPPGNYACRLVIRNLETGRAAVASSAAVIGNQRLIGIHLFPPLLLTPKKNAKYIRGNIPKPLVEKSTGFSLTDFFHFDTSQYSPHLADFVLANTLVPALLRCSIVNMPNSEINLSASLLEKSSGKITPLTLIVLSEELKEDEKRFLVNIHIPELPAGEYALNFAATEKTSKSESTTTRLLSII